MTDGRKYSDEEVRAILDKALARDTSGAGGLSHAELLSIGEQVGVSAEVMSKAAEEVRVAQLEQAASVSVLGRRRRWLAAHAALFAVLNGALFAVNAATTPGQWWVLFPVFFWGLALLLHAGLTFGLAPSRRALESERRAALAPKLRVEQEVVSSEEEAALTSAPVSEPAARR